MNVENNCNENFFELCSGQFVTCAKMLGLAAWLELARKDDVLLMFQGFIWGNDFCLVSVLVFPPSLVFSPI